MYFDSPVAAHDVRNKATIIYTWRLVCPATLSLGFNLWSSACQGSVLLLVRLCPAVALAAATIISMLIFFRTCPLCCSNLVCCRQVLSSGILQLQEAGKLHSFKEKWWKERKGGGKCTDDTKKSSAVTELSLANVGGVFVVLLLGLLLAALVGIAEFLWKARSLSKEDKVSFIISVMENC